MFMASPRSPEMPFPMRYSMPHFPCDFEIPDEWISEAGFSGFSPGQESYRSFGATRVLLTEIEPPSRLISHPLTWRGFDRGRFVEILKGVVQGHEIPPVPVTEMPVIDLTRSPYRYRILNGVHRFYASVAAGFSHLPVVT